jgi:CelD/BcsL family acetyltransferase involved in cellulose biosynthesis
MTLLTTDTGRFEARASAGTVGYRVELMTDWNQAVARWKAFDRSTPFQHPQWYKTWYDAFANAEGVEPLIVVVTDATTGEEAALLPLIRRRHNGIRSVEFADLDITDYNAPLLGPAAPRNAREAAALWRSLRVALREMVGGADLIRFRKLPVDLDGGPNPLALLDDAASCTLNGNVVTVSDDYDAWRYTLKKAVRKELDRSWRVFTRDPAATFRFAADPDEALRILSAMEVQQGKRMRSLGLDYVLTDETYAAFYRNLIRDGFGRGYVLVSALMAGEEVVATLLGIRTKSRFVIMRVSNAGEKWSNCSPGRLIIYRNMAALHRDGVRVFDLSIGNYAYKRRLGAKRLPLVDLSATLSWRGVPHALRDRAVRELRHYPRVTAYLKRALGMPTSRQED